VAFTASITKRDRTRILTSGATVVQTRFVVNLRHPTTGQRKQISVKSRRKLLLGETNSSLAQSLEASPPSIRV